MSTVNSKRATLGLSLLRRIFKPARTYLFILLGAIKLGACKHEASNRHCVLREIAGE
jgi:hypothetical protein